MRVGIRRQESFRKMDKVVGEVDRWFYEGTDLASSIDEFVLLNMNTFIKQPLGRDELDGDRGWRLFETREGDDVHGSISLQNAMGKSMHRIRELHSEFCAIFEESLSQFTSASSITNDQFKEIFIISQQEEIETGKHFYRWLSATDFTTFLTIMQQSRAVYLSDNDCSDQTPISLLRKYISNLSFEARHSYRRQKTVLPLLDMWECCSYKDVLSVLEEMPIQVQAPLATRKRLAKWRNILNVPKLGKNVNPEDDREEWAKYYVVALSHLGEVDFENAVGFLKETVSSLELKGNNELNRRSWEAFHQMDVNFTRKVTFKTLRVVLSRIPAFEGKSTTKLLIRHETNLRTPDGTEPVLKISDFRKLLNEFIKEIDDEFFMKLCNEIKQKAAEVLSNAI